MSLQKIKMFHVYLIIITGIRVSKGFTPLFKKGKESDPQNYRPISLTSLICKIMKSIIKNCILNHLK